VGDLELQLRKRLDALGPAPRAELLHVLMLPDFERADRIGEFWGNPKTRTFAELLIDCEEDRALRAVLVGMLREAERGNRAIAATPTAWIRCRSRNRSSEAIPRRRLRASSGSPPRPGQRPRRRPPSWHRTRATHAHPSGPR
jgi:hypothetical protein